METAAAVYRLTASVSTDT